MSASENGGQERRLHPTVQSGGRRRRLSVFATAGGLVGIAALVVGIVIAPAANAWTGNGSALAQCNKDGLVQIVGTFNNGDTRDMNVTMVTDFGSDGPREVDHGKAGDFYVSTGKASVSAGTVTFNEEWASGKGSDPVKANFAAANCSSSSESSGSSSSESSSTTSSSSSSSTSPTPTTKPSTEPVFSAVAKCVPEGYTVTVTEHWVAHGQGLVLAANGKGIAFIPPADANGVATITVTLPEAEKLSVYSQNPELEIHVDLKVDYPSCAPKTTGTSSSSPSSSTSVAPTTTPGKPSHTSSSSSSASHTSKAPTTKTTHKSSSPIQKSSTSASITLNTATSSEVKNHSSSAVAVPSTTEIGPSQLGPVPHTDAVAHDQDSGSRVALIAGIFLVLSMAGYGIVWYRRRRA